MTSIHPTQSDLPPLRLRLRERHAGHEILDDRAVPRTDLARSLAAMGVVNRWLGGVRSLRGPLRAEGRRAGGRLRVVDVGSGDGGLARTLGAKLRRRGIEVDWTLLDLDAEVLAVAAEGAGGGRRSDALIRSDALRLPFRDGAFDVAISSLALHHAGDHEVVPILSEMARVSRRRVLVSDLARHPAHYAGARVLGLTLWRRDPITRFDGPISVLRSFTRAELARSAHAAGLRSVRVRRFFPFRLLLSAIPAPAGDPTRRAATSRDPARRRPAAAR